MRGDNPKRILYVPRDDIPTFMDGASDNEKIDMIESPMGGFKDVLETGLQYHQQQQQPNHRVLGTFGMVAITYLYMSGGPVGSEVVMDAGGPLIGMIALIIYPLIVTIPYASIIAELSSAFPEDGGFTIWVLNAFGPFWGLQVGYWSWIAGIIRSALVPSVIVTLITDYFEVKLMNSISMFLIKASIAFVLALPTLLGTLHVSRASIVVLMIAVVPFLIFTIWAASTARDFDDLFEIRREVTIYDEETRDVETEGAIDIEWDELIETLFYKFDGIYMVSVFGGEVLNPARTFPRAIRFAVLLTVVTYLIPLPAAILADDLTWSKFDRDAYPIMAKEVGGKTLQTLIFIATIFGSIGNFTTGTFLKAFQVSGMAVNRLLPLSLAKRTTRFEAPGYAILVTTVMTIALVSVDFDLLLPMSNVFSCAVQFLIIIAAMRLRMTLPYIPRPTKVPGGIPGLALFALAPAAVLGYTVVLTFSVSLLATMLTLGLLVVGMLYGLVALR